MRRVSLDSIQPGMFLGKAILGSEGQVLLNDGVEIKPQYLAYLKNMFTFNQSKAKNSGIYRTRRGT
ncbi:MAG: hypothetical protein AB1796_07265 [Bacillota bacterium]